VALIVLLLLCLAARFYNLDVVTLMIATTSFPRDGILDFVNVGEKGRFHTSDIPESV
jgi:hypothetical protein